MFVLYAACVETVGGRQGNESSPDGSVDHPGSLVDDGAANCALQMRLALAIGERRLRRPTRRCLKAVAHAARRHAVATMKKKYH
eukprot:3539114-Pleurochrysis_carterae.AAC.1